ncbi:MAG: dTDP-4-dehydrorhamnose 3,5-epimerase [Spirochaetota bacterium]
MNFFPLSPTGAYYIELDPKGDARGSFTRLLCMDELKKIGHIKQIVQVNHSYSQSKGTIRGLHFQYQPYEEIKLVICIRGKVFDVIVDLRSGSPTFLKWQSLELSMENRRMMYIPEGFAHGFQTLEDETELLYFHTAYYAPDYEGGVLYNDQKLGIAWPLAASEISARDLKHKKIADDFKGIEL